MATRITARARDAANGVPDLEEVREEMRRLRALIEKASRGAAVDGRRRFSRAKDQASDQMSDLLEEGEAMLGELGRELARYEDRAIAVVRERPVQSIGVALAVGFLIAFFFRR